MEINIYVLDLQVRSHFPNRLFYLITCMEYAILYLCYIVENAIFTGDSGTDDIFTLWFTIQMEVKVLRAIEQ